MKTSTRVLAITATIVISAVGISVLATYSDFRYLTDGERGLKRDEMEELWRVRFPLIVGIGALGAGTLIGLLRIMRSQQDDEWLKILATGATGLVCLLLFFSAAANKGDYSMTRIRRPVPPLPTDVIPRSRWLALAGQPWRGKRPMGPLLEYGPGLRDFTGYLPFDPCLLKRVSLVDLTREQIIRTLGPPIPTIYRDRQYLEYRMKEPDPRGRIANLVFALERDRERGLVVTEQHLYPERISADCP